MIRSNTSFMTVNTFVGPDGKSYSENKPEEGGFLYYFDGCMWLISFPAHQNSGHGFYFYDDHLPTSAEDWKLQRFNTRKPFPAFIES
jgi:hypothetical protein